MVSGALKCVTEEAKAYVREAPVAHCDETGHKEKGEKQWVWVAIAGLVCVFLARASRGAEVAKELLGETFAGFVIVGADRKLTPVAQNSVGANNPGEITIGLRTEL